MLDPRATAGIDMLRRVGASQVQLRFSDDEEPVVWIAVVGLKQSRRRIYHDAAAALDPTTAILRLCEKLIDGGQCAHCKRPTGFDPDADTMPLNELVCWYQWDPELAVFRRGCEGA